MIELRIERLSCEAADAAHHAHVQVDAARLGLNDCHVTKNASEGSHDVAGVQIARRNVVQQSG